MSDDGYLNAQLGKEYKNKLRKIAEKQNRNMTSQIRTWIDQKFNPKIHGDIETK